MFGTVPPLAVVLGVAGLIPFIVFGLGSVSVDVGSNQAAVHGLIAYGGIILSFLGGVHWGFTLSRRDEAEPVRTRLLLGVIPAIAGWAIILVGIVSKPVLALAFLIAAFVALVVAESRAQKYDLMPTGYMAMRWIISVAVIAILTTVMVVRLLGAPIQL